MTEQLAPIVIRAAIKIKTAVKTAARRPIETSAALTVDESGTDVAEYALLFAMVGLTMVATLGSLGGLVANLFSHVGASFSNAA